MIGVLNSYFHLVRIPSSFLLTIQKYHITPFLKTEYFFVEKMSCLLELDPITLPNAVTFSIKAAGLNNSRQTVQVCQFMHTSNSYVAV